MGRTLVAVGALLTCASVAFASACSIGSVTPEQPSNETGTPTRLSYPDFLSQDLKTTIAYRDTMRPVDPCGYLDEAVATQVAGSPPSYLGAFNDFNNCEAFFKTPTGPLRIDKIGVAMGGPAHSDYGTPTNIGDTTIRYSNAGEFCTAYLALDDRQSLAFSVSTKSDLAGSRADVDLCPTAVDIAAAAVPLRSSRPLRTESQRANMPTKLAKLDPCSVLSVVAVGHPRLYVNPAADPWSCHFQLDRDKKGTDQHITYAFASDSHLDARYDGKAIAIDGLPAVEQPGKPGSTYAEVCQIYVGTRSSVSNKGLPSVLGKLAELITISTEGGGCTAARATATEIVRLYKQMPD
ncbi:hypothetical protein ACIHDR_43215 [Nocardia sp. NPDC052278]|uniref:hypothetical protein n=1 Tax=unclassified Nocardia TaxID=2637762 RepID=UPI003675D246